MGAPYKLWGGGGGAGGVQKKNQKIYKHTVTAEKIDYFRQAVSCDI